MSGNPSKERREALLNRILSDLDQSTWIQTTDEVDRLIWKLQQTPEDYITPHPDDPFWEDYTRNYEQVKDQLGLKNVSDMDEMMSTIENRQLQHAREEIRDQIADYGLETVVDALAGNPAPDDLEQRVGDILEEFPPDIYDYVIEAQVKDLYDRLGEDIEIVREGKFEELAEGGGANEQEVRREVLNQLEQAFGQRFDSVNEAVSKLKERIESQRGERAYVAQIRVRRVRDEVRVSIEDGDRFDPFQDVVEKRVRNELDLSALRKGEPMMVGRITLRGDDLQEINLAPGRERLGETAEPQPSDLEQRGDEDEQVPLEEATSGQLAERFIEIAEEGKEQ